MSAEPFGIDPVAVLLGLNLAAFIGWTLTLFYFRRLLRANDMANFWWSWWVETAVRHGIELRDDDVDAARELMPENSPSIRDQVRSSLDMSTDDATAILEAVLPDATKETDT